MYFYALSLLAQITQVHGAFREGDIAEVNRIGKEFDEDRNLLSVLSLTGSDCEAALANPSPGLRRSLARLRDTAAVDLQREESISQAPVRTSSQPGERPLLTIGACDQLLELPA